MSTKKYSRARVGIQRMNRIIEMARAHGTLTIKFVASEFQCYEKSAKTYLLRLVDLGLMTAREQAAVNSIRYFDLVPGVKFIPLPEQAAKPRPSVAKPKKRRIVVDDTCRRVHVVPAVQLGLQRDSLVSALFGPAIKETPQCA